MPLNWASKLAVMATVLAAAVLFGEAGVSLRPMSPEEVYSVLRKAGREDVVPEGRVVTQAISAVSGFGAGVVSGIGGALVYDYITDPNGTIAWANGILGIGGGRNTSAPAMVTQEICFKSRSVVSVRQGRYHTPTGTTGTATTPSELEGRTHTPTTSSGTSGTGSTGTGSSVTPTSSGGTSDSTMTPTSGTSGGSGVGTSTDSGTTTTDGNTGAGTTCIVIEKPKARHRRRRQAIMRHIEQRYRGLHSKYDRS